MGIIKVTAVILLLTVGIYGINGQTTPVYPGFPDVYYNSSNCIYVKVRSVSQGEASLCTEYSGSEIHGSVTAEKCLPVACQHDSKVNTVNVLTSNHCFFRLCTTPITETNLKLETSYGGRDIWIRVIDYCNQNPCQNGGTCANRPPYTYECVCQTGYWGSHCQFQLSQYIICESANGTQAGCTSPQCTWDTTLSICHHVGSSVVVNSACTYIKLWDVSEGYASLCSGGFTQGTAEINQCTQEACTLSNVNAINFVDGSSCYYRTCASNPTTQAITDLQLSNQYGGRSVWIKGIDFCNSATCRNGGTCLNGETTYHCLCVSGYTGMHCENNIDECESNPCQNGGVCQDLVNSYTCQCVTGYAGTNCDLNIDDCANNPCNHGQCTDQVNGFTCDCSNTGYIGTLCDNDIDECSSNPCTNGQCLNQVNSFSCDCTNTGYTGTLCEQDNSQNINGANSQSQSENTNSANDDSSSTAIAASVPAVVVVGMAIVGGVFAANNVYTKVIAKKKVNPYTEGDSGLANTSNSKAATNHAAEFRG